MSISGSMGAQGPDEDDTAAVVVVVVGASAADEFALPSPPTFTFNDTGNRPAKNSRALWFSLDTSLMLRCMSVMAAIVRARSARRRSKSRCRLSASSGWVPCSRERFCSRRSSSIVEDCRGCAMLEANGFEVDDGAADIIVK